MVDKVEASGMSSTGLLDKVVNISNSLKGELLKLQDELKTAQLITDILQKEAKLSNISECISASDHECRANYSYRKESSESSTSDWIRVRVSHAIKKTGNKPVSTGYRVQTSNRYAVLSNLQEALDNLPKTVTSCKNNMCKKGIF
jgi:hypothetical protein